MKIYTKTGDQGKTSLYGGGRVSKSSTRIIACGEIDELNSAIGLAISYIEEHKSLEQLKQIQFNLFTLGSEIATPPEKLTLNNGKNRLQTTIAEKHIQDLENWIDDFTENLEPLKYFILPSGGKASAHLHLARAICRRAERSLVLLNEQETLRDIPLKYLNRLSDYLFTIARFSAKKSGEEEHFWIP